VIARSTDCTLPDGTVFEAALFEAPLPCGTLFAAPLPDGTVFEAALPGGAALLDGTALLSPSSPVLMAHQYAVVTGAVPRYRSCPCPEW
jgi:hypothetical protein